MNRTSKLASLLVTGAAALGVVGCGSSTDTTTNSAAAQGTATTQQGTSTTQQGAQQGQRGPGAIDATALASAAKALDTTTAKLQAAMEAARPERPSQSSSADGTPPSSTGTDPRTAMYAAVAKELGTTSAKVETALADVLPSGGPGGGQGGPPAGGAGGTPPSGATGGTPPAQDGATSSASGATAAS